MGIMKGEDTLKQFIDSFAFVVSILNSLDDDLFSKKLYEKINVFLADYIKFQKSEKDNIAQYYLLDKLVFATSALLELLEYLEHLNLIKNRYPLLYARRNLLILKLEFNKLKNDISIDDNLHKEASFRNENSISKKNFVIQKQDSPKNHKLSPTKEKILQFIKNYPNKRPKDIIYEFSALSDRTVKRSLVELLRSGLIHKTIENKAVYYSAV